MTAGAESRSTPKSLFADPWRTTLFLAGALTLVRLAALFATPLELYPDEAQYWLWSRELAWGYYSKPPLIAWLIALTTGIGGNDEPWVRLSSLFLHGGAALVLFRAAKRLYDARTGFWAAALYSLMPGVQLSAGIASTDAPLLFFLSVALYAVVRLLQAKDGRERLLAAAGAGLALGAAFLAKYAAIYGLAGFALHALLSREARRAWGVKATAAAAAGLLVLLGPNLAWNAANDFATVSHTAANANWGADLFNPGELFDFLLGQLGVFGPVPFVVLVVLLVMAARRRALDPRDLLLVCLTLPPIVVVSVQAFVSRANANWAAAAFVGGAVLVAAWLVRRDARRTLVAAGASQAALAALFVIVAVLPPAARALNLDNAFKRARGWEATAAEILARAEIEQARGGLSAVAVDDRFLFNSVAYYGRDRLARPDAPPLKMWVRSARPQNQAETEAPLTPGEGGRVLVAALDAELVPEIARDFRAAGPVQTVAVRLDHKRERTTSLMVAEGFRPVPRDPRTGLPPGP